MLFEHVFGVNMNFPRMSITTTFILCVVAMGRGSIGLTHYTVNFDISDVTCLAQHVVFTQNDDVNKAFCVLQCFDDPVCKSVFFSQTKVSCVGCSITYGNSFGLPIETGTQYIVEKMQIKDFNPNMYQLIGKMTFSDGVDTCFNLGAHMLQVDSEEENEYVAVLFGEELVIWLGLTDEKMEGDWKWYNYTSPTGYTNWWEDFFKQIQHPDENCAVMMQKRDFRWSDRDCTKRNTLICEFDS